MSLRALAACAALIPPGAAAAEPDYRDDRSDPAALVESLYNAVSRHEYARAWSYFAARPPVDSYSDFVAGYAATASVELLTGAVETEGAAGSLFSTVPVAVAATSPDGTVKVFGGCYLVRAVQPALQEPPFQPLHIEHGTLAEAPGAMLPDALPAGCDADGNPTQ